MMVRIPVMLAQHFKNHMQHDATPPTPVLFACISNGGQQPNGRCLSWSIDQADAERNAARETNNRFYTFRIESARPVIEDEFLNGVEIMYFDLNGNLIRASTSEYMGVPTLKLALADGGMSKLGSVRKVWHEHLISNAQLRTFFANLPTPYTFPKMERI